MCSAFERLMREKLKEYSARRNTQQPKSSDASRSCPKFFFRLKSGSVDIRFFKYPFSVENGSHRECILGPKYYKEKKEVPVPDHLADHMNPRKRLCVMATKKSGCQLHSLLNVSGCILDIQLSQRGLILLLRKR
ncbi:uncharacterized protein LOC126161347 [Schistocerca cancellata]|uniref:uncharacterized protein LOC126161347 n=1 Tax=Schistocerca cancellata TaxID=274614 RepID=UPI002117BFE3|nr:uncharacterized protein LOC126161347 [Schistocerca cancellata]